MQRNWKHSSNYAKPVVGATTVFFGRSPLKRWAGYLLHWQILIEVVQQMHILLKDSQQIRLIQQLKPNKVVGNDRNNSNNRSVVRPRAKRV